MKISENRKGQAAIEYLVTYGWAILVLAVVALVLWHWGVFTPPPPPPDCRGFSQVQPFDWVADNSGDFTIVLINNAGTRMILESGGIRVKAVINDVACSYTPPSDIRLGPGAKVKINLTGCNGLDNIPPGDAYRAKINISYKNPASDMEHTSSGICWGSVE